MDISKKENITLKGKQVSVIGAARSGLAASKLLVELGAKVFLSDENARAIEKSEIEKLHQLGVLTELGIHSEKIYHADLIVVSPGVPQDATTVVTAKENGIPVVSEVELASWYTELPILAVTGSNGKTTTTAILAEMCQRWDYVPYLAGNIGIPFSKVVLENLGDEPENGIHVLEISSFQMEHIYHFKPKVAVLLNLTADHLDRYPSMHDYAAAKLRILENMTSDDIVVYNGEDQNLTDLIDTSARMIPFALSKNPAGIFSVNKTKIYDNSQEIVIYLKDISLPGRHNVANFLAAATACRILGVSIESIRNVMKTFGGVPHRLERVCSINGVDYYNDSKATNVDSVKVALESFSRPTILIMGGREKGVDFAELLPHLLPKVKLILVLGEASNRIVDAFGNIVKCVRVATLKSAVRMAHKYAQSGDIVLLSPGCASFDMFDNYEHRGNTFKEAVFELKSSR